jgi:cobalt-zinc-cadmium efflux system outer membrane protein
LRCVALAVLLAPAAHAQPDSTALSLADAVRLALGRAPALQSRMLDVERMQARAQHAGVRPNPALTWAIDDAGRSPEGGASREATWTLAQELDVTGRQRSSRVAARAEVAVAKADLELERLERATEVAVRYMEAVAAQRELELAREESRAADELSANTAQRVLAGAAHPVERRRTSLEAANARLEVERNESALRLAFVALAAEWGGDPSDALRLTTPLDVPPNPTSLDTLWARAEAAPPLARWQVERSARQRVLERERAHVWPPFTAEAGVRMFSPGRERGWVGALSIPLPLTDRNRAGVEDATIALRQLAAAEAAARIKARRQIAEQHLVMEQAMSRWRSTVHERLPEAERSLAELRTGFERGRFTYVDLLEARRAWTAIRHEQLRELRTAWTAYLRLLPWTTPGAATLIQDGGLAR